MKALLFINGTPPQNLPNGEAYDLVACSDGAFHYLKEKGFPLEALDFVSGDFDSHTGSDETLYEDKFILTPDQDKTDFEKSLELLLAKGAKKVDVYGASGGEMDHFLGNLSALYRFKNVLEICCYDEFSAYFFAPPELILHGVKSKMVSLYPYPVANNVHSNGLNWELYGSDLNVAGMIGTRNFALQQEVKITFGSGSLLVFVSHLPYNQF